MNWEYSKVNHWWIFKSQGRKLQSLEWVCDCCLMPSEQLLSSINFHFVLDQQA